MKLQLALTVCLVLGGSAALAEKFYGSLVSPVSGAALPAAFELLEDGTVDYCFQDVEENCFNLAAETLEGGGIRAQVVNERVVDGVETRQTNLWTWTPIEGGYHGRFDIQYEDAEPELQTEGEFFPK